MTKTLNTITMEELFQQPLYETPYLVDGLLAPGLYILGGSPKVGKSWLALQLCLAVCAGKGFLGRGTHRTEVLYLALEDSPQRLHRRALRLTDTAPQGLYLAGAASPVGQGLEQQVEAMLAEHPKIKLVIIDTLQKVRCAQGSGPSYAADYQDAAALKALADRNGVCILVIHHLRKMGDEDPMNRLSGTNGLSGAADGTLILVRENRQEGVAKLYATGRDIEDAEEELDFEDCRWSRVTAMDKLRLDFLLNPLQRLLHENGEFTGTASELADLLGERGVIYTPSQLSKYIQAHDDLLAKAGIVLETKRTSNQRTLHLWMNDTNDGNDGSDRSDTSLPVTLPIKYPSLPSQPSLVS